MTTAQTGRANTSASAATARPASMANKLNKTFRARSRRMKAWYARRHKEALSDLQSAVLSSLPSILEQPCPMQNLVRAPVKTITKERLLEYVRGLPNWP